MSKAQGWVLMVIVAFGVGWYIADDVSGWPTRAERALANHAELMNRLGL